MNKTTRATASVLTSLIAASLAACSTPTSSSGDHAAASNEPATLPEGCLALTDGARARLAGKISETVPSAEVLRVGLVTSDASEMSFLAVEFTDPGLDNNFTGIWGSTQDLTTDEDPAFVSVDDVAAASSDYLQPANFVGVGAQLPAAEEAVTCMA